jgi:hypothetical protein
MKRNRYLFSLPLAAALVAGCSNGAAQLPSVTQSNLSAIGKLEFAVGLATLPDGSTGLNTVATFRQSSGASATLVNTPSIVGPAGFTVPGTASAPGPCSAATILQFNCQGEGSGSDAGTNTISGQQQSISGSSTSTFGMNGGLFSAGFAPYNATNTGTASYPSLTTPPYAQPFYYHNTPPLLYVGGPPAYPFTGNGLYPGGFIGWVQGFNTFAATPVAGTYTLNVKVPASNAAAASYSATATLKNMTPLSAYTSTPTLTNNGSGGATIAVAVPADSRIVETLVYVVDINPSGSTSFYTVGPQSGNGTTLTFTLPGNLGSCGGAKGSGCQNNASTQSSSMSSGDTYAVYAASFDYPMFEAEPPGNTAQAPSLTGAAGQADLTLSPPNVGTY